MPPEALPDAQSSAGAGAERLVPLLRPRDSWANSTDLLVLREQFTRLLWVPDRLAHVRWVAVPAGGRALERRLAAGLGGVLRRLEDAGTAEAGR